MLCRNGVTNTREWECEEEFFFFNVSGLGLSNWWWHEAMEMKCVQTTCFSSLRA